MTIERPVLDGAAAPDTALLWKPVSGKAGIESAQSGGEYRMRRLTGWPVSVCSGHPIATTAIEDFDRAHVEASNGV